MKLWDTMFPPLLTQLHALPFDYADGDGIDFEPYEAFLSARETAEWFRAWTGNRAVDGAAFRVFGQDGTGGYAAFWLADPAADLLDQPVVFFGSEGELGVVAASFHDYLWLLAGGVGPYEAVEGYPGRPDPAFTRFADTHAASPRQTPADVVERARRAHPAFVETIRALGR